MFGTFRSGKAGRSALVLLLTISALAVAGGFGDLTGRKVEARSGEPRKTGRSGLFMPLEAGLFTAGVTDLMSILAGPDTTGNAAEDIACPGGQKVWDGGGATNNWSEAANWCDNTLPNSNSQVRFNATSTKNANVDAGVTVSTLTIEAGYTGALSVLGTQTLTVTSGITQDGGTINVGSGTVTVPSGGLAAIGVNAGVFNAGSGTVNVPTGAVMPAGGTFDGANATLNINHITPNGGAFISTTGTMTMTAGIHGGNPAAIMDMDNGTVVFAGSIFSGLDRSMTFNHVRIEKSTDTAAVTANACTVNGTLDLTRGRLQGGGFIAAGAVNIDPGFHAAETSPTAARLTLGNTGGTARTVVFPSGDLFQLTVNDPDTTVTFSGGETRLGTVTIESGTINVGSATVTVPSGGLSAIGINGGVFNAGSGTVNVPTGAVVPAGGTFDGANATLNINQITPNGGTFISTTGTMNMTSGVHGGNPAAILDMDNGTVVFVGPDFSILNRPLTFGNVRVEKSNNTVGLSGTATVNGTLDLVQGRYIDGTLEARGPVSISAGWGNTEPFPGTLALRNGSGPRTLTLPTSAFLPHLIIDDDVHVTTQGPGALTIPSIVLNNGTFDLGDTSLTTPGNYTQTGGTFNGGSGNIQFGDSFNCTFRLEGGTFTPSTGTNTICLFNPNPIFSGNFIQTGGVFAAGPGQIDLNGALSLSGGVFNAPSTVMHIGQQFLHTTAGTFNHNNGTVVFDGHHPGFSLSVTTNNNTEVFNNVTIDLGDPTGTVSLQNKFEVNGTFRVVNGFIGSSSGANQGYFLKGNAIIESNADGGTARINFIGSEQQTFTNNGAPNTTGIWTVDKTDGVVTAAADLILGTSQQLNIASGTLLLADGSDLTAGAITIGEHGVLLNDSSTTITLGGNVTNNGIIDLQGGGAPCPQSDSILLRSSVTGTQRNWTGTGAARLADVDVQDMAGTAPVRVFSGTNSGNNGENWTFDSGCPVELSISPQSFSLLPGQSQTFTAGGGIGNYTFSLPVNNSGGSINSGTGLYTAGPAAGVDTVRVTDGFGHTADATVNVGENITCPGGQKVWDGGGATNNWSEAANWCDDTLPTSGSQVRFNATSPKNAAVDITTTINTYTIEAGYTGTISIANGVVLSASSTTQNGGTINVGSGTLNLGGNSNTINGGTLNAGSGTLSINFFLVMNGGTFNGGSAAVNTVHMQMDGGNFISTTGTMTLGSAASGASINGTGGTMDMDNGTIVFIGTNGGIARPMTFKNLVINKADGHSVSFLNLNVVNGTLDLVNGRFSGTLEARGQVNMSSVWGNNNPSQGTLALRNGSGPRTFTISSGAFVPNLIIDDNVLITPQGPGTINISSIVLDNGTIDLGETNLTLHGAYTQNSGSFSISTGNISWTGSGGFTMSNGTFNGGSGNIQLGGVASIITLSGGTLTPSTGTNTFGVVSIPILQADFVQSGGIFAAGPGLIDINGRLTLTGGTFNASSGETRIGHQFFHTGGGTFNHNNGTVIFDGHHPSFSLNVTTNNNTEVFNNLTIDLATTDGQVHLGGRFEVNGTFRVANGFIASNQTPTDGYFLRGNAIIEPNADGGNARLNFIGSENQTFTNNGAPNTTGTWTVDKTDGVVTAASDLILGTSQQINIASGTLLLADGSDLTAGAITIGENGVLLNDSSTTITLGGNVTNNGRVDLQGGGAPCPQNDSILLRSSSAGVQRQWLGTGFTRLVDVDVRDMAGTQPVRVFSGTNSGNNDVNWTFDGGCPVELSISPQIVQLSRAEAQTFAGGGGYGTYRFSIGENNSGGTINAFTGLYTAGNTIGVTDTITVTDGFAAANAQAHIVSGPPAQLAYLTQPTDGSAGFPLSPIKVMVQDNLGNMVPNATNQVTLSLGNNPGGSTLAGTLTRSAVNGIATFDDITLDIVGTGYTLNASSAGLTGTTSDGFNITAGGPVRVVFSVQPSNVTAGQAISPEIQVAILDGGGNPVPNAINAVTLTIANNPGGAALSGQLTRSAVNGVATFPSVSLDRTGSGYTLNASSVGLIGAVSGGFDVAAAAPSQLAVAVPPTNAVAGEAISPAIQIQIRDAFGNNVPDATNLIELFIANNPGGSTLSGTTARAAVNGVATFDDISLNRTGTGYTLTVFSAGLTGTVTGEFDISAAAPAQLAFTIQPANTVSGMPITPAIEVIVRDSFGNSVPDAVNPVTLSIGNNPGGATLSGTLTRDAVDGVAVFDDISLDLAGTGYTLNADSPDLDGAVSNAFNIFAGGQARLSFTVHPSNVAAGQSISPAIEVAVLDANGNQVPDATDQVTLSIANNPGGATLSGTLTQQAVNGKAFFFGISLDRVGSGYTLNASASKLADATSTAFDVTHGAPAQLVFTVQPSNAVAGEPISPAIAVTVRDEFGNDANTAILLISLSIANNPGGASMSGTSNRVTENGTAVFDDISLNRTGTGYTLSANSQGLPAATSEGFNITPGAPAKLGFVTDVQSSLAAGQGTLVFVCVRDSHDNDVASEWPHPITLSIANNPGNSSLLGEPTVMPTAAPGCALFFNIGLTRTGIGYTLAANSPGLIAGISNAFNITPAVPAQLAFITQPSNTEVNTVISPPVQVAILDSFGNQTTASRSVTVSIGPNVWGGTLQGTPVVESTQGVATFSDLRSDRGGSYAMSATSPGLMHAVSQSFSIIHDLVVTNTNSSGPGSLDQAIILSNQMPGQQTITFNIPGSGPHTIAPTSVLHITDPLIIDGTTQPGYAGKPVIELNGQNSGNSTGIQISAIACTVKGLAINRFLGVGIFATGGSVIQGNYIGTDVTGTVMPEGRSQPYGIKVFGNNNLIGGDAPGEGNLISGNTYAIEVLSNARGTRILGNLIGTKADGISPLPNSNGVALQASAQTTIGGTGPGEANIIAYNSNGGIYFNAVQGNNSVSNSFRGNRIFTNGGLGIDLFPQGVTPNDPGDADTGANKLQNFPELTGAQTTASQTSIRGRLNSAPSSVFTIDFYRNAACDPSGHGEGEFYLGSTTVTTNASNLAGFTAILPVGIPANQFITATATDADGNTSEFSKCVQAAQILVSISGTVTQSGSPMSKVPVTLAGHGKPRKVLTDKNGSYAFADIVGGANYTVTPSFPNYEFAPPSRTYTNLLTNQTNQDFAGQKIAATIRGSLRTAEGLPISEVNVVLSGTQSRTLSRSDLYSFGRLPVGTYSITASKPGWTFAPVEDITVNSTAEHIVDLIGVPESPFQGRLYLSNLGDSNLGTIKADGTAYVPNLLYWFSQKNGVSPDGRKVIDSYNAVDGGGGGDILRVGARICNIDRTGCTITDITHLAAPSAGWYLRSVGWSPDGTRVAVSLNTGAFRGNPVENLRTEIWIIDVATGNITRHFFTGREVRDIDWIGNDRIAYLGEPFVANVSNSGPRQIFARNIDGTGGVSQLTNFGQLDGLTVMEMSISNDGAKLAYLRLSLLGVSLRMMNPDGTNDHEFMPNISYPAPAWSPDDTKLVVAVPGGTSGRRTVIVNAADGAEELQLFDSSSIQIYNWTPDIEIATPAGTNVQVDEVGVSLNFAGVNSPGTTTLTPINPASVGDAPNGFVINAGPNYSVAYEITTTAAYTSPITVCFTAAFGNESYFNTLALLHNENGVLVDRTTSRDFLTRKICGTVNTLSPFVLAEQVNENLPSITGYIQDTDGDPMQGVVLSLTGSDERFAVTDIDGYFQFVNLTEGESYTVQPKRLGYIFDEYSEDILEITGEETLVFTGQAAEFQISGRVTNGGGAPIEGATVELEGSVQRFEQTAADGTYSFTDVPAGGSYLIRASKPGFNFLPLETVIEPLMSDQANVDFSVMVPTAAPASISGRVIDANGRGIQGATVTAIAADGSPRTVTTNTFGYYRLEGLAAGQSYVLTVSSRRHAFADNTRIVDLSADIADQDFIAATP